VIKDYTNLKKILLKPINYLMLYLFFVLFLYFFGPLNWRTENTTLLIFFLLLSQGLIYLGFKTKANSYIKSHDRILNKYINRIEKNEASVLLFLKIVIPINVILVLGQLVRSIGLSSFSLEEIINNVLLGITNPGKQYSLKFENDDVFGGGAFPKIITLLSPILWSVIPLSLYYFKKFNTLYKFIILLTILLELSRWVSIGTNKGFIDIIIIIVVIILLRQQQKKIDSLATKNKQKNKRLVIFFISTVLLITGLNVFEKNISSRINNDYRIVSAISNNTEIDLDSPVMKITPKSMEPLLVYLTSYLTQGYYGLSLTFDEPFIPMYGIGNSYFLIVNLENLFEVKLWENTYQSRIEYKGWDSLVNWHSLYVWLANDFSYFGVLILMFFLGRYFAMIYYKSLIYKDPITIVLFCLMIIGFFYLPANNQILSYPSTFMTFCTLNFILLLKKFIKRN